MKKFKILDKLKKIILIILCTITVFFSMPVKSNADIIPDFTEILLFIPDAIMKILSKHVSGEKGNLSEVDINLDGWDSDSQGQLYNFNVTPYDIFTSGMTYETVDYNGNYSGESIKMPLLNINFFKDTKVQTDATNSADILRPVISSVYKSLRNVVLIVMLVVLLYVGIRIIIASAVSDQVKYKQWIMDWVIGICLVVVLQYIMSFLMNVNEMVVKMLGENKETMYHISLSELEGFELKTPLGFFHFEYESWGTILEQVSAENNLNDALADVNINYERDHLNYFFADHIAVAEGKFFNKEKFTFDPATATMDISNSQYTAYNWGNNVPINARIFVQQGAADRAVYRGNVIEYLRTIISFGSDYVYEYKPSDISGTSMLHTREGSKTQPEILGYVILYLLLVVETVMFLYTYLKRVFKLAFYTMIAPLIAFMYPIDKLGDGKAQAFNTWFKEYLYNVLIQPLHLLLYTVFIYAGMELMRESMIYAIAAYAYMIAAEKFFKKIFGFDKAPAGGAGGLASPLAGAMAMDGLNKLKGSGGKGNKGGKGSDSKGNKIKLAKKKPAATGSGGGPGVGTGAGSGTGSGTGGVPSSSGGGFTPSGSGATGGSAPGASGRSRRMANFAGVASGAGRELNSRVARRITGGRSGNVADAFTKGKAGRFWGGLAGTAAKGVASTAWKGLGTAGGAALGLGAGALAGMAASALTGEDKFLDGVKTGVVAGGALGFGTASKSIDWASGLVDKGKQRYGSEDEDYAAKLRLDNLISDNPDTIGAFDDDQLNALEQLTAYDNIDAEDAEDMVKAVMNGNDPYDVCCAWKADKKHGDLNNASNFEAAVTRESEKIQLSQTEQDFCKQQAEMEAMAKQQQKIDAFKAQEEQLKRRKEEQEKILKSASGTAKEKGLAKQEIMKIEKQKAEVMKNRSDAVNADITAEINDLAARRIKETINDRARQRVEQYRFIKNS